MPGERQLVDRSEDADVSVAAALRRQHESGFGQVHLVGDALHQVGGEVFAVEEHCDWIAVERPTRERVDDHIVVHAYSHSDWSVLMMVGVHE